MRVFGVFGVFGVFAGSEHLTGRTVHIHSASELFQLVPMVVLERFQIGFVFFYRFSELLGFGSGFGQWIGGVIGSGWGGWGG